MVFNKIRTFINQHKKQILLTIFSAGCASMLYLLLKKQQITVKLQTFTNLIQQGSVEQVIIQDQQLFFRAAIPQLLKVDTRYIDKGELKQVLKNIDIIELPSETILQKYKTLVYGTVGMISLLLGKLLKEKIGKKIIKSSIQQFKDLGSSLDINLSRSLDKIQSCIPRVLGCMRQKVRMRQMQMLGKSAPEVRKEDGFLDNIKYFLNDLNVSCWMMVDKAANERA